MYLKQSTAVDIALGPFVNDTDGVSPETGLTITQADVRLKKNAGNWAQKNDANAATHEENGWYEVPLDATDTNTLGILVVAVNESGALPVWREFTVLAANIYDALVGGGDLLQVDAQQIEGADATDTIDARLAAAEPIDANVVQISGDATAADSLEAVLDGTGAQMTLTRFDINGQVTVDANVANEGALNISNAHASGHGISVFGGNDGVRSFGSSGSGLLAYGSTGIYAQGSTSAGILAEAEPFSGAVGLLVNGDGSSGGIVANSVTIESSITTILNRLGAFTGSGVNTILGFFRAIMRAESALTPSDVGGTYDNETDSLEAIADSGGSGLTQQQVRDAMKLAPTAGAPDAGSVDEHLDDIEVDTQNIQSRLPTALVSGRMESDVQAIATAVAQAIADEVLKRSAADVEDTADPHSLTAVILAALESTVSGTTWTIRKTDGSTFTTKTVTVDAAADPITGVT